ncbi:predicted protein [Chaetomium globosum CBS 148.51]|uniref:Uncharacterized protein n=1 Tax=Chaetomium globosum (strain ATCC 6205 / CBS 148.51 / DSM 1962 / NBRC 6347 / NRRL 1970) TaxID=306901 RepID=Q2GQ84_CHAGB|nr:uncharacterized protein CHGG_09870 [Chaetomium globosum CBS 148.51]EAQ83466.1 predicted protein [Chaetomium globosum CBS 148.51]
MEIQNTYAVHPLYFGTSMFEDNAMLATRSELVATLQVRMVSWV